MLARVAVGGGTRFRGTLSLVHLKGKGEKPQPVVVFKYFAQFNVFQMYCILLEAACMSERNG